jgi:hypothetical protein
MICCLFIAALLAPLGFSLVPAGTRTGAACCVNRSAILLVGGVIAATLCIMLLSIPQAAPFHHICRFSSAPRT